MKSFLTFIALLSFVLLINAQKITAQENSSYLLKEDISYRTAEEAQQDEYIAERCKLDVYYPENRTDFTTVVWFHGGGITGGNKSIPEKLKEKGIAVVVVNYRLSPKV